MSTGLGEADDFEQMMHIDDLDELTTQAGYASSQPKEGEVWKNRRGDLVKVIKREPPERFLAQLTIQVIGGGAYTTWLNGNEALQGAGSPRDLVERQETTSEALSEAPKSQGPE